VRPDLICRFEVEKKQGKACTTEVVYICLDIHLTGIWKEALCKWFLLFHEILRKKKMVLTLLSGLKKLIHNIGR
jgi:DTW domain-containing protein YfiP